jgi:hypothetical protein
MDKGLPAITSPLTIRGAGTDATILARPADAPPFRHVQVAASGHLRLTHLTVQGNVTLPRPADPGQGGGILNEGGTVHLVQTTVTQNGFPQGSPGGGLSNQGGTVSITQSTFAGNHSDEGGGLFTSGGTVRIIRSRFTENLAGLGSGGGLQATGGTVIITQSTFAGNETNSLGGGIILRPPVVATLVDSTVVDNSAIAEGGGIANGGLLQIMNSTIARNRGNVGGGIFNTGTMVILNATITANQSSNTGAIATGIATGQAPLTLQNTLLAGNALRDCFGPVTSLGTNLIGDPTGCTITLRPSDLTGDPGLDTFTDNGRPGHGHFPLLPTSQAIDVGSDVVCPRTDQLERRRIGPCDIGAIEFRHQDDHQHDEENDSEDADPAAAAQAAQ